MAAVTQVPDPPLSVDDMTAPPLMWPALNLVAGAAQFWHGYKRNNDSIGWGLLWAVSGAPSVALGYFFGLDSEESIFVASHAPPLAAAAYQGFAEPLKPETPALAGATGSRTKKNRPRKGRR